MTVPAEIVRKVATFQVLTQAEKDRWGDEIDYKRVHLTTKSILDQAAYHATSRVAGHGGPSFWTEGEPEPWQHKDAVGWLWDQFGLPRPHRLKDDPGFLRADYQRALEATGDKDEAIRTCMKDYHVGHFKTMVQRLHRAGVTGLPWDEKI